MAWPRTYFHPLSRHYSLINHFLIFQVIDENSRWILAQGPAQLSLKPIVNQSRCISNPLSPCCLLQLQHGCFTFSTAFTCTDDSSKASYVFFSYLPTLANPSLATTTPFHALGPPQDHGRSSRYHAAKHAPASLYYGHSAKIQSTRCILHRSLAHRQSSGRAH